jgi:hypothetical protein
VSVNIGSVTVRSDFGDEVEVNHKFEEAEEAEYEEVEEVQ